MKRSPYAVREVGAVCAVLVVGLMLLAPHDGPHRDELYFVRAGKHLVWGHADQPRFTPLLARLADVVATSSVTVLRIPAVLAVAGVVALSAQAARLLGAARAGQALG